MLRVPSQCRLPVSSVDRTAGPSKRVNYTTDIQLGGLRLPTSATPPISTQLPSWLSPWHIVGYTIINTPRNLFVDPLSSGQPK